MRSHPGQDVPATEDRLRDIGSPVVLSSVRPTEDFARDRPDRPGQPPAALNHGFKTQAVMLEPEVVDRRRRVLLRSLSRTVMLACPAASAVRPASARLYGFEVRTETRMDFGLPAVALLLARPPGA